MTSSTFRTQIMSLAKNWSHLVQNNYMIDATLLRQDWFSLRHVTMRRCFCCHKRCYQEINDHSFGMLIHHKCLLSLTETMWFFDYRKLHLARFVDRLGPQMCAVVEFYLLTPDKLKNIYILPYVNCNGRHKHMGPYTYQRIFVETNHLTSNHNTLYGMLNLTENLPHILQWYNIKHNGHLKFVSQFPKIYKTFSKIQKVY